MKKSGLIVSFFPKRPHYIGIDAELSTLKIASISKKGNSYVIGTLNKTNTLQVAEDAYISSLISSKQCLIRSFDTPLVKDRDIFNSLDFQAEAHLPYPTEQALIQGQIISKDERITKLTIGAIRKDHLQNHLDTLQTNKIVPDLVTSPHFALAALSTLLPGKSSLNLYIHIGKKVVTCTLAENGKLLSGYAFDTSLEIQHEIHKLVLALNASFKSRPFDSIFLFGNASQETLNQIAEITGKNTHFPFAPLLSISQEDLMQYALAIGAALAGAQKKTPNFRQKEFVHPHPFKRLKKPLTIYGAAMGILSLALFSLTNLALSHQKKEVEASYLCLLSQESKEGVAPKNISEYTKALATLKREIEQKPNTFPLHPVIPRVKEVLAWLASSPVSISVDTFHYSMVSRPTFSKEKEHYQVKVFLEFSAPVVEARAFHEMLLANNPFVDKKHDIQWSMNRDGVYRTSFFLKDKTKYL